MYYTIGMNSFDLLRITDLKKVPVYNFRLGDKKACCTGKFIALDYSRIETDRECKRLLAEEMGHVLWVATYPLSYCADSLKEQNVKQQDGVQKTTQFVLPYLCTNSKLQLRMV